ncbi:MAG TPA: magnesium/cobalt transporter CorA [Candidatus Dormibacteraeota bacterium]|nr:magnesium/cobalt transporter CorA [Candidatus Dormibacteraeota bacterium]
MRSIITTDGQYSEPSVEEILRLIAAPDSNGFWLDIERPDDSDYSLLLDGFRFHPLTVEDVRQANQRPKMDEFPGYCFTVLFTAELAGDRLIFREHHLYLAGSRLVTIHHEREPALEELRRRIRASPDLTRNDSEFLHYLVFSELVESLFPVLEELDETIDQLEDAIVERPTNRLVGRITGLKHSVSDVRRILGAQRDVFQRLLTSSFDHVGNMHADSGAGETSLYWRDIYDHLIRQYEQVDSLRDLLTGSMDVYLSTVSNRLNTTMKQLTVIASLFLPLTFITGFFGMNFGYMVTNISTGPGALAAGISLMVLTTLLQLYLFHRRGWI